MNTRIVVIVIASVLAFIAGRELSHAPIQRSLVNRAWKAQYERAGAAVSRGNLDRGFGLMNSLENGNEVLDTANRYAIYAGIGAAIAAGLFASSFNRPNNA